MCVNPYIAIRKDGSPVAVPCGKCLDCRKAFQTEWIFRLEQEAKRTICPCFITLTYDNEHLPLEPDPDTGELLSVVSKRDWQLFMKRLRKIGGDDLKNCRYFAIGEYGSKFNRAHMHAIIIAPALHSASQLDKYVKQAWQGGFSVTRFATRKQFHYVCKYMNKIDDRHHLVKPFRLFSRSIGLNFLTDRMIDYYLSTFDRTCVSGKVRIGLPRYYKRKLDDISYSRCIGFKESGLSYSDLLEDIKPVPGTKYFFLREFTDNFGKYYEQACARVINSIDGVEFEQIISTPTRQQVWQHYVNTHKVVRDLILEDERLLSECKIKNKLIGAQPVAYDLPAQVILSECQED